jgi:pyridoxal phosphate enzyme (YggS family)
LTNQADIACRLTAVRERVALAAQRSGRDADAITLIGVGKRMSEEQVVAAVCLGLRDLGENYVQEAVAKIPAVAAELARLGEPNPRWHFIGQLQSNKAKDVVRLFDTVCSLDRVRLGAELERRALQAQRSLDLLIQVNLSGESSKGGVAPNDLGPLLEASAAWPQLRVVGLMGIPAAADNPEDSRPHFAQLRELRDQFRGGPGAEHLSELSMGMTGDFEVAIEEGATIVRVGTAIFGPRSVK